MNLMRRRSAVLGLCSILFVGLALRLALASWAPMFLEGDSQSYLLPGWELAQGQGFSPELRRAPAYPVFIAVVFRPLADDLQTLALAQHAVGLLTVLLAFLIGRRLFGWPAGLLAALLVAISGSQLIYERYLMTEALFGFTLTLAGLAMVWALQEDAVHSTDSPLPQGSGEMRSRRHGQAAPFLAGAAIGLAALTRPVAQVMLPLFLLALLLFLPRGRPTLKAVGLTLVGFALISGPWMIHNLVVHDALGASGGLGRSLIARTVKYDTLFDWKWLSETYGGRDDLAARARMLLYRKRSNIPDSRSVRPYQDALTKELGLSQGRAEAIMREVALEAISRRPLEYLGGSLLFTGQILLGRDEPLQRHWRQRATKDWDEQWDDRLDFLVVPVTPYQTENQPRAAAVVELFQPSRLAWPLVVLAVIGSALAVRRGSSRPTLVLAAISLALVALSAFLDGPVPRYRYPVDPLIAVAAAGGAVGLARSLLTLALRNSRRPALLRAAPRGGSIIVKQEQTTP